MTEFTDKELKILKEFIHNFRYSFSAFLREAARPSPDVEYQRRMSPEEALGLWTKLALPGAP